MSRHPRARAHLPPPARRAVSAARELNWWHVLPWLLVLGVALIEVSPLRHIRTAPLLSAAPPLAAVTMGVRGVSVLSAAALVVGMAFGIVNAPLGSTTWLVAFLSIAIVVTASVAGSAARVRRERALSRARRVAETAQRALLRPLPPVLGDLRIAAVYRAADPEARVGGDLFEVVPGGDRTRLLIGDVRGKGMPAVYLAAVVLGAFREAAVTEEDLPRVARRCSAALLRQHAAEGWRAVASSAPLASADDEAFVTACFVEIRGPLVRILNHGHPEPLLLAADGVRTVTTEAGLPLGLEYLGGSSPTSTVRWNPGDRLVLITDGVAEARDAGGEFFDVKPALRRLRHLPPRLLPAAVVQEVLAHTGDRLDDDAAVLAVQWTPAGTVR
ncbi:PP2C family protein-serine/threonine phosphatase [Allostreptomyces psammosilenae]|uniref:PPM-type phosphatase domain-containing protein n=1 Tax=Allostreptomyces psammosilenae TaxID=1892865 RepID=A0A852ZMP9_9ACTN|nr:PP2C family protein-serine/threonine phosphatase [Allostreptomyces psammosilenae]NYI03693.1 hypothetical protein [Allostreptomyces psammosilenae]